MEPSSSNVVRSRVRVAALAVLLVLAAACSSSGSSKSSTSSDTGGKPTTTAAADTGKADTGSDTGSVSSDTGTDTSGGKNVTKSDLEELLPSASEIGSGYSESASSDTSATDTSDSGGGDAFQSAADKQCPELAKLSKNDVPDSEKAQRTYSSSTTGSIEVSLNPKAKQFTDAELDEAIKKVNDCGEITAKVDGNDAKITFSVERDDSIGDQGLIIHTTINIGIAQLNKAFTLEAVGYGYKVGGVGVTVSAQGDIDQQTLEVIPPDDATAKKVAADLEPQVQQLTGG